MVSSCRGSRLAQIMKLPTSNWTCKFKRAGSLNPITRLNSATVEASKRENMGIARCFVFSFEAPADIPYGPILILNPKTLSLVPCHEYFWARKLSFQIRPLPLNLKDRSEWQVSGITWDIMAKRWCPTEGVRFMLQELLNSKSMQEHCLRFRSPVSGHEEAIQPQHCGLGSHLTWGIWRDSH